MSTNYQTQISTRTISYINQANTIGTTSRAGNAYPDLAHVIFFFAASYYPMFSFL
jgi:hypothetical protein